MRGLSRMADLILVNLLAGIFFVPAIVVSVVTISMGLPPLLVILLTWLFFLLAGPALTAMHYVLLKMTRDEESYITRSFFKSFRENFVQSIGLAAIVYSVMLVLIADAWMLRTSALDQYPMVLRVLLFAVSIYMFLASLWVFPMQCHFVNTVLGTIRNSFFFAILVFPRTLGMAALAALPILLLYFFDMRVLPILLMFGFSGPGYFSACLYNKAFKRFEPEETTVTSDEEFHVLTEDEETPGEASDKGENDAE